MQKYYEEQNVESCFNSILDLKQQSKTGIETSEVLEKFKPVLLELLEAKIPVKTIVKHFHTHDVKIPQNILSKFISSIRPKKKVKRIKKTHHATTQTNANNLIEKQS